MELSLRLASIKYCPRYYFDKVSFTRERAVRLPEGAALSELYEIAQREYGAGERVMVFKGSSPLGGSAGYESAEALRELLRTPLEALGVAPGDVLDVYQCQRRAPRF